MPANRWPRAIVFDLDGTLIDSAGDIADCLNAALAAAGLPPLAEPDVIQMIGGGARVLVERALVRLDHPDDLKLAATLEADFTQHYVRIGAGRSRPFPGCLELLEALRADGTGLAICTNKPDAITRRTLDELGLTTLFATIVGETPALPRKPDPAMLLAALSALRASPADAVMVGDSAADVGAARAAGIQVVAVSFGYTTIPATRLGADAVIDRLPDLPAALARLRT